MHLFHVALLAVDETAIVCVTVGHQCHPRSSSVQCMFSVASVRGWLLTLTLEPFDIIVNILLETDMVDSLEEFKKWLHSDALRRTG